MEGAAVFLGVILVFLLIVILSNIHIIQQFERGVVFTLGKYSGIRNPGWTILIPWFQTMRRVDVRSTPIDVPKQEVITKDNVTVNVDAIVYFRVLDPAKALLETTNYVYATTNFAQAALREVIDAEDKHRPLSDEALTALMSEKGFPISRRTIAKYRDVMGIPTSRMRRQK